LEDEAFKQYSNEFWHNGDPNFRIGSLLCLLTNLVEILQNDLIKDCMVLQD
jgi:hypothetical protein